MQSEVLKSLTAIEPNPRLLHGDKFRAAARLVAAAVVLAEPTPLDEDSLRFPKPNQTEWMDAEYTAAIREWRPLSYQLKFGERKGQWEHFAWEYLPGGSLAQITRPRPVF